jgi:hypothetical protein
MKAHSEHESVARVLVARCAVCAHSKPELCSRFGKYRMYLIVFELRLS